MGIFSVLVHTGANLPQLRCSVSFGQITHPPGPLKPVTITGISRRGTQRPRIIPTLRHELVKTAESAPEKLSEPWRLQQQDRGASF